MKHRVPVTERMISKLFSERGLVGKIESQRTAFYDADGNLVCELEENWHESSAYGLKAWYMYMGEYKSGGK